jgi:DHA2 family multidrug resistance protein
MGEMVGWTPDVSQQSIILVGFVQGAGLGFLFVPLTTVTFVTLPAAKRGDGTGLYNLSRNIGSAVGISVVSALLVSNTQVNHSEIVGAVNPYNHAFDNPAVMQWLNPTTAGGQAMLNGIVTRQAEIIAYMDDFKLLMIMAIAVMPLVWLLKKPAKAAPVDHSMVVE